MVRGGRNNLFLKWYIKMHILEVMQLIANSCNGASITTAVMDVRLQFLDRHLPSDNTHDFNTCNVLYTARVKYFIRVCADQASVKHPVLKVIIGN